MICFGFLISSHKVFKNSFTFCSVCVHNWFMLAIRNFYYDTKILCCSEKALFNEFAFGLRVDTNCVSSRV